MGSGLRVRGLSFDKEHVVVKSLLLVFVLLLLFNISEGNAQDSKASRDSNLLSRYVNQLVNDTSEASRPQFLVYPTVAYSPETSWEFGLSSLYVFYANRDTANRMSEIDAFTFITLENQYGLWFDHAIYTNKDRWFFLGRWRYQSFPLLYFGIGPDSPPDYLARVYGKQLQFRERVLGKVYNNLFFGFQLDYQRLSAVEFVPSSTEIVSVPYGGEGSANLGLGASLVYDTRHNVLNVRKGIFSEQAFVKYASSWGSDYSFTSVISDNRIYRPVNSRDVLAFQVLGQFNVGEVPFNQLALMGGESIMRGYYLGRFRDNNQLATQLEYRFLPLPLGFTDRIGAALFGGTGAVFYQLNTLSMSDFKWSAGGGLRFLLFPKKDIYTRFDVAFTGEGTGFYIFIGEAF